jgi:hypothetical protein
VKNFAETAIAALQRGQPIPAPPEGWTGHHLVTAAGVLYAAVLERGPHDPQALSLPPDVLREVTSAPSGAGGGTLEAEVHAAIDFVASLAVRLLEGTYDQAWGPVVTAVAHRGDGGPAVLPLAGQRGPNRTEATG